MGFAPDRAAAFAYRLEDLVFVDLRLQFGWRGCPGWWGVVASAIQEVHQSTTWASPGISVAATEATSHVGVLEPTRKVMEPLQPGCRVPKVRGGDDRDPAWVIFFVDDAVSVEIPWRDDGARCKALTASLVDAHFQAMGERAEG